MKWYTADWHLFHRNIIRYCDRPFAGVDEMNAAIIARYLERVSPDDEVYVLGDVSFWDKGASPIVASLPGRKHLIVGNHDRGRLSKDRGIWESITRMRAGCGHDGLRIEDQGKQLLLRHYPSYDWRGKEDGVILLHGHSHGERGEWPGVQAYDVGVDVFDFAPVTLDEILRG